MHIYFVNLPLNKTNKAMEITFLKDHLDNKKGDKVEVDNDRAEYFIRTGVAKKKDSDTKNKGSKTKELKEPYSKSEEGTKGIVHRKTPEEADAEIKELNKK